MKEHLLTHPVYKEMVDCKVPLPNELLSIVAGYAPNENLIPFCCVCLKRSRRGTFHICLNTKKQLSIPSSIVLLTEEERTIVRQRLIEMHTPEFIQQLIYSK